VPPKTPAKPVEMGAAWTSPNPNAANQKGSPDRIHAGNFLIQDGKIVGQLNGQKKPGSEALPGSPRGLKPGPSHSPSGGTAKAVPFQKSLDGMAKAEPFQNRTNVESVTASGGSPKHLVAARIGNRNSRSRPDLEPAIAGAGKPE